MPFDFDPDHPEAVVARGQPDVWAESDPWVWVEGAAVNGEQWVYGNLAEAFAGRYLNDAGAWDQLVYLARDNAGGIPGPARFEHNVARGRWRYSAIRARGPTTPQ